MSKFFGESPEKYRDFVEKNIDLKFHELTQLFMVDNENVSISASTEEKIVERI